MTYILEKISTEDQDKIIKDFSNDPELRKSFELVKKLNQFPTSWAIDRQHNCYLLAEPRLVRPESDEWPYVFFGRSQVFRIASENTRSNKFYFKSESKLSSEERTLVKKEIGLAFSVYGRWGAGEFNEFGMPEFRVAPMFKEDN